jgi:glycosyltransferase involved in cell wall biosynthesis
LLSDEIRDGRVVTGYRTKILPELKKSRIFVSIIEPDNYPSQSVLEAMYTGNALLLSDRGFTKERFFNGNGRLCEISFEDVLSKLTELVQDLSNLDIYGRNSLEILNTRYNKDIYIDYIKNMYNSVEKSN